jgi:hypothetical protein
MRRKPSFARRVPLLLGLSACGAGGAGAARDASPAEHADPRAAICAGEAAAAPSFAVMEGLFDQECASCHAPGADLDLSQGHAWADVVGQPAPRAESCGGTLVVPGNPDASYLYQKLSSSHPCSGQQMPLAAEIFSNPLPDCVVALVRAWIAAGAPGPAGDASAD